MMTTTSDPKELMEQARSLAMLRPGSGILVRMRRDPERWPDYHVSETTIAWKGAEDLAFLIGEVLPASWFWNDEDASDYHFDVLGTDGEGNVLASLHFRWLHRHLLQRVGKDISELVMRAKREAR